MLDGSGALAAISREVPQDTKRLSTRGAQACEEHKSRFFGVSFPEVSIDVGISNFLSCTLWLWLPLINCKVQSATVSRGESKDEKLSKCTANAPACRCSSEVPTETYFFFFSFFLFWFLALLNIRLCSLTVSRFGAFGKTLQKLFLSHHLFGNSSCTRRACSVPRAGTPYIVAENLRIFDLI